MLGTLLHNALGLLGISPESVSRLLQKPCRCEQRRQALDAWAQRVLSGRTLDAIEYLNSLLSD